jgi:hypothetical protein
LAPTLAPYTFTAPLFESVLKIRSGEVGQDAGSAEAAARGGGGGGEGGAAAAAEGLIGAEATGRDNVTPHHPGSHQHNSIIHDESSSPCMPLAPDAAAMPVSGANDALASPSGFSVRLDVFFLVIFCNILLMCVLGLSSAYGSYALGNGIRNP